MPRDSFTVMYSSCTKVVHWMYRHLSVIHRYVF